MFSGFIKNMGGNTAAFYELFGLEHPRQANADGDIQVDLSGVFNDEDLKDTTLKNYRGAFKKFTVSCCLV